MDYTQEIKRRFLLQKEYLGTEKPVNKIQPLVSVSVATYQHEKYIKQCLDGILMQQTTFPFEVIIGEDDSKDETRAICIEYANKYPDKIRLFLRERQVSHLLDNEGKLVKRLNGVLGFGRMSSRGKYIALCEGDDYWTDPNKLQIQVDLLEKHKAGFSFHAAEIVKYEKEDLQTDKSTYFFGKDVKILSNTEIIDANGQTINSPLASFVFKTELIDQLISKHPTFYPNYLSHTSLILWAGYFSKILYIPKYMSVYRLAHTESWTYRMRNDYTYKKNYNLKTIRSFIAFNEITELKYDAPIKKNISSRIFSVIKNINIPIEDRIDFFKQTNEYNNTKNKIVWFLIFKRKKMHQFINWLYKSVLKKQGALKC